MVYWYCAWLEWARLMGSDGFQVKLYSRRFAIDRLSRASK